MSAYVRALLPWGLVSLLAVAASAGVTNPDISAIGQVLMNHSNGRSSPDCGKYVLALGETEVVLDAPLNPYLKGTFVVSLEDGAADVEEAYATLVRGLPLDLALKAGKYRVGFGKLNAVHSHAYPFIETPRVLDPEGARLLPGKESFNDVAVEASTLIPFPGGLATTLSASFLEGDSFHPDTSAVAHGWLAHASNAFLLGPVASDIGVSLTQGVHDVAAGTKTTVFGADAKAKLTATPLLAVTIGAEYLHRSGDRKAPTGGQGRNARYGFYTYTDARYHTRYDGGVLYERYQDPSGNGQVSWALRPFVGFSVLEESTILRLSYEYFAPAGADEVSTIEMQLLFSMGPHKAHQF